MQNAQPPPVIFQRARVPWRSDTYNDETVLHNVLQTYPSAGWAVISIHFNKAVPASRQRSLDAIISKGKAMQRKARKSASSQQQIDDQPTAELDKFSQTFPYGNPVFMTSKHTCGGSTLTVSHLVRLGHGNCKLGPPHPL